MDFNLTEEQIAFQNSVRSLADKYLTEGNLKRAHDPLFPKDIAKLFSKKVNLKFIIYFINNKKSGQ